MAMRRDIIKKALANSQKEIDKTLSNIQSLFNIILDKVNVEIDIETGNFKIVKCRVYDNVTGKFYYMND